MCVLACRAAPDETEQPESDQHDDHQPDQVDQTTGRVEQQPEDEKNDRKHKQRVDHLDLLADMDLSDQDRKNPERQPYTEQVGLLITPTDSGKHKGDKRKDQ
jgi:hypothetical protein